MKKQFKKGEWEKLDTDWRMLLYADNKVVVDKEEKARVLRYLELEEEIRYKKQILKAMKEDMVKTLQHGVVYHDIETDKKFIIENNKVKKLEGKPIKSKKLAKQLKKFINEKDPITVRLYIDFKKAFLEEEVLGCEIHWYDPIIKIGKSKAAVEAEKEEQLEKYIEDCHEITAWISNELDCLGLETGEAWTSSSQPDIIEFKLYYGDIEIPQKEWNRFFLLLEKLANWEGIVNLQFQINDHEDQQMAWYVKEEK